MKDTNIHEKELKGRKIGGLVLLLTILLTIGAIVAIIYCGINADEGDTPQPVALFAVSIVYLCIGWIPLLGLKVLKPNEALVLTLFGKYIGTLKGDGFFYVIPSAQPSTRQRTHTSARAATFPRRVLPSSRLPQRQAQVQILQLQQRWSPVRSR